MFSRNSKPAAAARTKPARTGASGLSLIGAEVVISGDLASPGQLHIEGRVDGHVRCNQLSQNESGAIAGDIVAEEVRIGGLVEGTVTAGTVVIEATGRVMGDVAYDTISIAAGARVEGRLARREALAGADLLVAMPTDRSDAETGMLFSGAATRIAAD